MSIITFKGNTGETSERWGGEKGQSSIRQRPHWEPSEKGRSSFGGYGGGGVGGGTFLST